RRIIVGDVQRIKQDGVSPGCWKRVGELDHVPIILVRRHVLYARDYRAPRPDHLIDLGKRDMEVVIFYHLRPHIVLIDSSRNGAALFAWYANPTARIHGLEFYIVLLGRDEVNVVFMY